MSKLKEIRKASGLSQSGLSESSDVSIRMIQYYEQGSKDINKANGETLYKLSKSLKCKMEDIIETDRISYKK